MNNIASVVISNSTREFDREYHYLVPEPLTDRVKPGMRVIVPFGGSNRTREAYVLKLMAETEIRELKVIKKVIDESPVLNGDMLNLAAWMKSRYICTYADAVKCMLPAGIGVKSSRIIRLERNEGVIKPNEKKIIDILVECGNECEFGELQEITCMKSFSKYIKALENSGIVSIYEDYSTRVRGKYIRAAYLSLPKEEVIDEIESSRIKKIQQIRVLEMLMDNEYIAVADIVRFAGVSGSVLDTLKKYGYIDFRDIEVRRDPLRNRDIERTEPLIPTSEQAMVLGEIKAMLCGLKFNEVLLHGVTGSGKTEVYLQLIQHVIEVGKQAIVLVPEISLTPQMVERFKGRFGNNVAVLHSRLSLGERYDQWRLIKEGRIKVAVGARSAVFAPFSRLGMIIIDEEHEGSYKSETTPKYHATDIARKRCMDENAILLCGSATPSVETYHKAKNGEISLYKLDERANKMGMPRVEIVDMRSELDDGNRSIFSRRLVEEIDRGIRTGQQTMLFLNRRGYAAFVLCRNCGYTLKCINCNISLTYHSFDERLICHYCGYTIKMPKVCPKCKSTHIRQFGTGTQRVEDDIKKQFPGCSVIRMDMDTTTYKNSHEDILRTFREQNINIMIGTQMIAKGHDFPNVTLVGVLAADSMLNIGDYKATEKTFQLITQVAGRAGRGVLPGRVVIQTYNTEDFSILAACRHDYGSFYSQEIIAREKLNYPPFTNIAVAILSGTNDRLAFNNAKNIRASIIGSCAKLGADIEIFGPTRSPLSKIKNKYRWRVIIKCKCQSKLIGALTEVSDGFYRDRDKAKGELSVDINPVNML